MDGLHLTVTLAQHFSGRGFTDGNRTLWASWVIQDKNGDDDFRLFFSGDAGYFNGFATEHGMQVSTLMMGERVDMNMPQEGNRWWRQ